MHTGDGRIRLRAAGAWAAQEGGGWRGRRPQDACFQRDRASGELGGMDDGGWRAG